ncbi:MAG: hypothetical protein ACLQBA_08310 [Candidatus Binataceae bacterium]
MKEKQMATVEPLVAMFEIYLGPILAEINAHMTRIEEYQDSIDRHLANISLRLTRIEEILDRSEARQRNIEAARLTPQGLASVEAKLSAQQG